MAGQTDAITVDGPDSSREITIDVAGTAPLASVTILKTGTAWRTIEGTDDPDANLDTYAVDGAWTDGDRITGMAWGDDRGTDGDVHAVRVLQASDDSFPGMVWVGPLWVEST